MEIRLAKMEDLRVLLKYDSHISENVMRTSIINKNVLVMYHGTEFMAWLRWNLFWDNTPFMNMLYFLEPYRQKGYGTKLVKYWEDMVKEQGYSLVMTSTLADENAQHFYRKLGYIDSGSLILKGEALEIIFTKAL